MANVKLGIIIAVIAAVTLVIGFLIGFFSSPTKTKENPLNEYYASLIENEDNSFNQKLINEIDAKKIENHLRIMTNKSHMGGTSGDLDSANYIYDTWKSQNLDYVKKIDYDVLLAFPDPNTPNSFEIIDGAGQKTLFNIIEAAYDPELNYSYIPRPFLAYSAKGSYESDKVYYANYGTLEDFEYLKEKGLKLNDSIVICRYGKIFRGNKVKLAAQYGAKGVLIYEDPIRGAPLGQNVYPDGEFLPRDGMQRGSLYTGNGDPLTPMYPSTKYGDRLDESDSKELPTIIAQVIGYDHAYRIFKMMEDNVKVTNESEWKGSLNMTYTYGGVLKNNQKLKLNVYSERKVLTTYNVIGIIKGETEPDRYVLMGNHRDAWVLGAIDPTSGTAALLEISRALSELKLNKGWRPKRSIIFCSWGAEEFGLIGSTEWVEEFQKKLSANGVAYLNIDIAVQGNYSYYAKSTPLLFDLILNVTKTVKLNDKQTVYDRWLEYAPNNDKTNPVVSSTLGSGSDYMGFQQRIGLACIDSTFAQNTKEPQYKLLGTSYPTYHSSFETFNLVSKYIDPGFKSFKAIATVVAELARRLSDSLILPFNCNEYAKDMVIMYNDLSKKYGDVLKNNGIELNGLKEVIDNFGNAAKNFHNRLNKIDKTRVNLIRQYNDQLKNLEKSFIDPIGIARNGYQHILSAPSIYNSYGGDGFPALSDAIFNALKDSNWKEVKKQLSIVCYVINSASSVLDEPDSFERVFN